MEDEVAGKSEERITDKEQTRAQSVGALGDSDGGLKGLFCKADIGAVEKRDHIHGHEEGSQALDGASDGAGQVRVRGGGGWRDLVQLSHLELSEARLLSTAP